MTVEATDAHSRRLPVLLPGKRRDMDADTAAYMAPTRPGDPEASFGDFLDIINPLQHIPIVSSIYRGITGDEIGPVARIVGGALYGGVVGAGVAMAGALVEQVAGEAPDELVVTALGFGRGEAVTGTAVAAGPGGLIAEAGTRVADAATTAPAPTAIAATPTSPGPNNGETAMAQAKPVSNPATGTVPQLSPAAFDTLIRAMGGEETAAAEAASTETATAAAGATEDTRRFFPAHRTGTRAPRPVPMDIRAEDKAAYDDALRLMRQNMDRYSAGGLAGTVAAVP
ncbi:hypothetical protein L2U69_17845 [Zavarzinia compransoris]|uniref:hypothetical protein n=1 Tax=Zavarzinia marina TaxID=2911065 RepID=UPI001F1DEEF5|nr:hypothetical protein [Zavarzinia marina]MCF4167514.1 hypothetical protein [Zavarzinia marina]